MLVLNGTTHHLWCTHAHTHTQVHEDVGAFNWALFKPHKSHAKLHNAGSLGVTEMVKWLPENEVQCGWRAQGGVAPNLDPAKLTRCFSGSVWHLAYGLWRWQVAPH